MGNFEETNVDLRTFQAVALEGLEWLSCESVWLQILFCTVCSKGYRGTCCSRGTPCTFPEELPSQFALHLFICFLTEVLQ